jgi:hypothetical protein
LSFFRKYAPPKKDEVSIKKAIDAACLGGLLELVVRGLFATGFEVCPVNYGSCAVIYVVLVIAVVL